MRSEQEHQTIKTGDVVEAPTTLEERLEIAAMVTRGLEAKITLGNSVIESYKNTVAERDATLLHMARFQQRLARKLAGCGSDSHAGKNQVILSVVADLLANAQAMLYPPSPYDDDVPF